jgi:acyl carrier protein
MNRETLRSVLLETLASIAPDCEPDAIDPAADLREEMDLDSMDMSNLLIALQERLDLEIPELDAPRLTTLDGALDYLAAALPPDES